MNFSTETPVVVPKSWKESLAAKIGNDSLSGEFCEGIAFTIVLNLDRLNVVVDDTLNGVKLEQTHGAVMDRITLENDDHSYTIELTDGDKPPTPPAPPEPKPEPKAKTPATPKPPKPKPEPELPTKRLTTKTPIAVPKEWEELLEQTSIEVDEQDDCKTLDGKICKGVDFTLYLNSDKFAYWLDVTIDDTINGVYYDSEGCVELELGTIEIKHKGFVYVIETVVG